ncbi:SLC13 family permease [Haloglomus salinum]|jgi:di/tricarboxylate transporter|uniref:SLC13 family permease n=1 Tax=Haloglomus salinum TaxID=2962673 RepID=UPI0020C9A333|nr:SLC13 family permease [Haloglomus salinum]
MALPPVTTGMAVTFGLVFAALALFVSEKLPPDVTAIGVLVALAVLEPLTQVSPVEALSGFGSAATLTVLAMYILSEGVQRTGIVERLGLFLGRITGGEERRVLAATVSTTGLSAGFVNNTPVVAVFIPMVTDLAEQAGISRSRLLMPLSFAAMLGGKLTLVGTASNLIASDLAVELLDRGPIGMFEFTPLGVVVLAVGIAYLLTVGRYLVPERVAADTDLTEAYELEDHLSLVTVREDSPFVGQSVHEVQETIDGEEDIRADLLRIEREGEGVIAATTDRIVEAGDALVIRSTLRDLNRLVERYTLRQFPREVVTEEDLLGERGQLVEAVVLPDSALVGTRIGESILTRRLDTTVLAVKREGGLLREDLRERRLRAGDTLLLQTTPAAARYLTDTDDLALLREPKRPVDFDELEPEPLSPRTPVALGTLVGVILLAALDLLPIVIAALAGVFVMLATDCLSTRQAYDAVSWNVIFLLAGILPLGMALQRTGGAALVASLFAEVSVYVPTLALLGLVFLVSGLVAALITPVAMTVLMVPVAVDTASQVGADGFAFLLAVLFAGGAAFATPIGYQTNLMVYGPGGYRFTDFTRVGLPLQLVLAVVVTLGIAVIYGV